VDEVETYLHEHHAPMAELGKQTPFLRIDDRSAETGRVIERYVQQAIAERLLG
jgi:hypothetical protein